MEPVIRPEILNILGSTEKSDTTDINRNETRYTEAKPAQTRWKKLKSFIADICDTLTPVVNLIVPIIRTVSIAISAFSNYCRYANSKSRNTYAV